MAQHNTPEERQLSKIIEKMPVSDDDKKQWLERLQNDGLSSELGEEIRTKLLSDTDAENTTLKAQYASKLVNIMRRWRLNQQTQSFRKRG